MGGKNNVLMCILCLFLKVFFLMFIFERERERERESEPECERGWGRKSETQDLKQTPGSKLSAQSLTWGSN